MATITEDYCSKELSLLLDKKGFDGYSTSYSKLILGGPIPHSVAMKWLREVHGLPINVWYDKEEDTPDDEVWRSEVAVDRPSYIFVGSFPTYEQACEAAIKYCLENLI